MFIGVFEVVLGASTDSKRGPWIVTLLEHLLPCPTRTVLPIPRRSRLQTPRIISRLHTIGLFLPSPSLVVTISFMRHFQVEDALRTMLVTAATQYTAHNLQQTLPIDLMIISVASYPYILLVS